MTNGARVFPVTSSIYRGAKAAMATMHGKEAAIAPAMEAHLGLEIVTPAGLDTDILGTFSGEIPRIGTMLEVAVRKARIGMRATGLGVGIASEGSFGPHPVVPFLRAGMELMVLVDDERSLIISESFVTDQTNHDVAVVVDVSELGEFLARVMFPSHALVVGPNQTDSPWWRLHPQLKVIRKGIRAHGELADAVSYATRRSEDGRARVMTDMRAHMNPTRMQSITDLAALLAQRVATECPHCRAPGFGRFAVSSGIPCISCGEESIIPRGELWRCAVCNYACEEVKLPKLEFAQPADCPRCNA